MSKLVWVPYRDEAEARHWLGDVPAGLELDYFPNLQAEWPERIEEVAFVAPENRFLPVLPQRLSLMESLEVLQLGSAGYEHVLHALPAGVTLCNAAGVHDAATAEAAVTLALTVLRDVPFFLDNQRANRWVRARKRGLADKRVLIVGYGRIGRAIEQRVAGFEPAEIVRVARRPRIEPLVHGWQDLPELVARSEVVFVMAPHTSETEHMFDAEMLARLPDGAVLINAARGPLVDTQALLAEVRSGRIQAGLDVIEGEPVGPEHPAWDVPGLVMFPHIASFTDAEAPRYAALLREQLQRYAAGEALLNQVSS